MEKVLAAFAEHCVYADLPPDPRGEAEIRRVHVSHEASLRNTIETMTRVFQPLPDRAHPRFRTRRQGVSEQEATDWAGDLQKIGERGGYFFCLNQFLFVVVKPLREQ